MTVYVDNMEASFGRMKMCHMMADTEAELHAMADRIGVARKWFQKKASGDHYDIAMSKRKLAVGFGAVEISMREMAAYARYHRQGLILLPSAAYERMMSEFRAVRAAREAAE